MRTWCLPLVCLLLAGCPTPTENPEPAPESLPATTATAPPEQAAPSGSSDPSTIELTELVTEQTVYEKRPPQPPVDRRPDPDPDEIPSRGPGYQPPTGSDPPGDSGDPGDDDDGGEGPGIDPGDDDESDGTVTLLGQRSGNVQCLITQTVVSVSEPNLPVPEDPAESTAFVQLEFGSDGVPDHLWLPGFVDGSSHLISVGQVGDVVTVSDDFQGTPGSIRVEFVEASYSPEFARTVAEIELAYEDENGFSVTGLGVITQEVEALSETRAEFRCDLLYEVELANPSVAVNVTERHNCHGILTR